MDQTTLKRTPKKWAELAQSYLNNKQYLDGYWASLKAIENQTPGTWPHDLAGTCAYYIGLKEKSLEHYTTAWKIDPNNQRIISNIKMIRREMLDYNITILWPTIRPKTFKKRIKQWELNPNRASIHIAVNTEKQKKELSEYNVIIVGEDHPGVAYASYCLAQKTTGLPGDIIILASDDFHPPPQWDFWVYEQFKDFHGCLLVNDAKDPPRAKRDGCITIPIMDLACLKMLNNIIYHPAYNHLYSDNELFDNLQELNLIKDLRGENYPIFEHVHWYDGRREGDEMDLLLYGLHDRDRGVYESRRGLSLGERLVVGL